MIRRKNLVTKRRKHEKWILTPGRKVAASFNALESPAEATDICIQCALEEAWLSRYGASLLHTHKRINAIVISVPVENREGLRRSLHRKGFQIEKSKRVYPLLNETVQSLEVPQIWDQGFWGKSVKCAVLDTGIDQDHADFSGRIKSFKNFSEEGNVDRVGHGTHVAGILGGAGKMFRGLAPEVDLMIGKVLGMDGGDDTDVIAGLSWASQMKADVINLSLGGVGDPDDPLSRECNALSKEGFLLCVAAGNSGPGRSTIGAPGCVSGVITVGAVDKQKNMASYSSRGPVTGKRYTKPDLVSFGGGVDFSAACVYKKGVVSAKSSRMQITPCDEKRNYTRMSGTSMATPHVAGIVILLLDMLNHHASGLTRKKKAAFIKQTLKESAVPLQNEELTRWDQGAGFLDAARAFDILQKLLE